MANTNLSRRNLLKQAPLALAGTAIATTAIAVPVMSSKERLEAAAEELKLAAEAHYPNLKRWIIEVVEPEKNGQAPVLIIAS